MSEEAGATLSSNVRVRTAGGRRVNTPPISWDHATRVATTPAARQPPLPDFERDAMVADFVELTAVAEGLVERETGLRSLAGPARARVTDRPGWVRANVASFQRLLRPLADRLAASGSGRVRLPGLPAAASGVAGGMQVGLLLAWMSTRVLGQYDQLLIEDERPEDQDVVYYVGPNIAAVERRYGFPPREFRLWLALHEVTHRAQFTGVPWMREHFLGLVEETLAGVDADPRRLLGALRRSAEELRAGRSPLDDGGLLAVLATPEQRVAIRKIGGLMSLLEGHGDVTMDRAALDRVPNAARFGRVLTDRRRQRGASRAVSSLVGLDAKLRQYEQGERFVRTVEDAGGRPLFDRVWQAPEWLPSLPEIRQPDRWIARAGTLRPAIG